MGLAIVHSRARVGVHAPEVRVEVHLGGGLPSMSIVGLPEAAGFSNTLLCFDQVHLMVEAYLQDNQVEVPDDWTRVANLLFKRKTRKLVEGSDRVRIEGKQRTVRVVGRVASDIVATSENVIVEVLKNGPVSRQIRSTGTVVDFSRR